MITAHIPAGYVTGRLMPVASGVIVAAVIGGITPDLDFLRYYLLDDTKVHHHRYWTHIPGVWALIALVVLPIARVVRPASFVPALAFFLAVFGHLVLDTLTGGILWLWPWSDAFVNLIEVPERRHWVLDPILHPVFLAEIAIWVWAFLLWRRRPPVPA